MSEGTALFLIVAMVVLGFVSCEGVDAYQKIHRPSFHCAEVPDR